MRIIRKTGSWLVVLAMVIFTGSIFLESYEISSQQFSEWSSYRVEQKGEKGFSSPEMIQGFQNEIVGKHFSNQFSFGATVSKVVEASNEVHMTDENWDMVVWTKPGELSFELGQRYSIGPVREYQSIFFLLTIVLGALGGLMFILPGIVLDGPPGIKNHHVYHQKSTNKGWVSWVVFAWLVLFYIVLYFWPNWIVNWTLIAQPAKSWFGDGLASQWFLYGFLYCTVMVVMGIRMYVKYRRNKYQIVRTTSVIFFQVVFAFLLIELLPIWQLPAVDFKNAWPLDYDFLYDWNVKDLLQNESYGKFGFFVLVWGIVLALIIVPLFVYFFGKRWYCSWVCGCGGLAETLGDPYRQHSSKSLFSWKVERWLVHSVLVFCVIMTAVVGFHSYNVVNDLHPQEGQQFLLGIDAYSIREAYGFFIGAIFAGVIGTGFYPTFGNRVWCRFGCPLAAYMGIIQRFKSRFRITTNGGQCISCGNCSTYCEQGIDVRWYAQRGQNVVRASCVGCGICSAVCPRGVLKLENGPEEGRLNTNPIQIGPGTATLSDEVTNQY